MAILNVSDEVFDYYFEYGAGTLTLLHLTRFGFAQAINDTNTARPMQRMEFMFLPQTSEYAYQIDFVDGSSIKDVLKGSDQVFVDDVLLKINTDYFFTVREWLIQVSVGRGFSSLALFKLQHVRITRKPSS